MERSPTQIDHHLFSVFLADKLQHILDDFAVLDDPHERLSAVLERARKTPPLPGTERTDEHRVRGCVSIVWLVGELRDGRCYFRGDAESPLVRGLVVFLCEFFTGASATEIAASDVDPLEALGVLRNLSPTRRNGLSAVRNSIQAYAKTHRHL